MTLLIGIAGRMRTGKSSLANLIQEWLANDDNKICIDSFAEALRQELAEMLWDKPPAEARFMLHRYETQDKTSIRPLLQAWGQAKRDLITSDYWVDVLRKNVQNKGCDIAIIDDVRHHNEADYILRNGGILIHLHAPTDTLVERGAEPERLGHYSETAFTTSSAFSFIVPHRVLTLNTGGMSALGMFKALKPFLEEMIEGEEE